MTQPVDKVPQPQNSRYVRLVRGLTRYSMVLAFASSLFLSMIVPLVQSGGGISSLDVYIIDLPTLQSVLSGTY